MPPRSSAVFRIFAFGLIGTSIFTTSYAGQSAFPFITSGHFSFDSVNSSYLYEADDAYEFKSLKGDSVTWKAQQSGPAFLWSHLDSKIDQVEGISLQKADAAFAVPAHPAEVIVAVIDSGVDIHHADLKGKIWVNPGIDADGNDHDGDGYQGDLNGWNFIGNLKSSTLECTRELARLTRKEKLGTALSTDEKNYEAKLTAEYSRLWGKTEDTIRDFTDAANAFLLLHQNGLKDETLEAATSFDPGSNLSLQNAKQRVLNLLSNHRDSEFIQTVLTQKKEELKYAFNPDFDPAPFIQDHPEVLNEKGYGNNDVVGPNPEHGTHVAGIIAANRIQNIPIFNQDLNVKILPLRVVPDGDERDKDVANAIRFAVDHHARIINMSFGKHYSPQKSYVDQAVRYAERHNVLIVHAAGNDGVNTDSFTDNFPNKKYSSGEYASNWIEVGASAPSATFEPLLGKSLVATFSNWGKLSVDLFAPGISITSLAPHNLYETLQGTSMAAPLVSRVAALLLSFDPNLSAGALRYLITSTALPYPDLQVYQPGTVVKLAPKGEASHFIGKSVPFADLSASGGIVNAYEAVSLLKSGKQ